VIIVLRNFFCDVVCVGRSHQNHAIHLESLSDALNLCCFECMFMWYEHVSRWYEKMLVRKTRYSEKQVQCLLSNFPSFA